MERLSASNAAKHIACHASANLPLAIPGWEPPDNDGNTAASMRGDDLHLIMAGLGLLTPREMRGVTEAAQYVAELRSRRRFTALIEHPSEGWWLKSDPKPRTTADVVLYVQDEIHVVDYKFGKVPVHADDNAQGKYYSLAYLPLAPKCKGVTFHIVQPFIDNFSSTFFSLEDLAEFENETLAAEAAIAAGDTTFGPSDACTFCPANPHSRGAKGSPFCPAMLRLLYPSVPLDEDALLDFA